MTTIYEVKIVEFIHLNNMTIFLVDLMGKLQDYRKKGFLTAFKGVKTIAQFIPDGLKNIQLLR